MEDWLFLAGAGACGLVLFSWLAFRDGSERERARRDWMVRALEGMGWLQVGAAVLVVVLGRGAVPYWVAPPIALASLGWFALARVVALVGGNANR